MAINIAVDGPAGAGKSTIAKLVAKRLGIVYVDTGAMYRTIGLYMLRNGIDPDDEEAVCSVIGDISVGIEYADGSQIVMLNGENVSELIRTPQVSEYASKVSSYKPVRQTLVSIQQKMAENTDLIMDGRDIGTCVLPMAEPKIYLTASSEVRGMRRYQEMTQKGQECNLDDIIKDIKERDYRDMNRKESPLRQAEDAVLIDSSFMSIEEVAEAIIKLVGDNK